MKTYTNENNYIILDIVNNIYYENKKNDCMKTYIMFFSPWIFTCFILKLYIIMHCTDIDVLHIDLKYL